jgi:surface antigen
MYLKQFSIFLLLSCLAGCTSPTVEHTTSAWVGGLSTSRHFDTNPCAFLKQYFKLDKGDYLMIQQIVQHAFEYAPDGRISMWKNPNSGNEGTLLITSTLFEDQLPLRKYIITIQSSKGTQTLKGVGKRYPNGTWVLSGN